ncbi:hypothetical protein [Citreimonas salinaria]|uniref:Uncharacterized protein n=1 Tax=Citreimonas salinaria TaxID=321339 RepID=A0A1H3M178_9RHOB|nr:hypothetical protein [Citreimonas salinaria]SDY70034.1 hypothetical protein SAMN05444340_11530 [Citreimonas salinaria]
MNVGAMGAILALCLGIVAALDGGIQVTRSLLAKHLANDLHRAAVDLDLDRVEAPTDAEIEKLRDVIEVTQKQAYPEEPQFRARVHRYVLRGGERRVLWEADVAGSLGAVTELKKATGAPETGEETYIDVIVYYDRLAIMIDACDPCSITALPGL